MPNSGATGYGAVSRHLWLLLWESSSLLDSCICLKVFLCRVQIYHLDPKHECWRLLGKEHDATTEILWPKGILKEPHDVAEESGAKGGGGGKGGTINEPEIKFECHNKTIPLCTKSPQPESEMPGKVCVQKMFKAKHL